MNRDGTKLKKLFSTDNLAFTPRWSPDGRKIVFFFIPGDGVAVGLYKIDADGTNLVKLMAIDLGDSAADWGPRP